MADRDEPKSKAFTVKDNRVSTQMEHGEEEEATTPDIKPEASSPSGSEAQIPPIDFVTFILSLSTSCLVHLGDVTDESGAAVTGNLPLAKQTIDLLGLLEEKTKGNLTGEEERLLSQVLYDLRMRYVQKQKDT